MESCVGKLHNEERARATLQSSTELGRGVCDPWLTAEPGQSSTKTKPITLKKVTELWEWEATSSAWEAAQFYKAGEVFYVISNPIWLPKAPAAIKAGDGQGDSGAPQPQLLRSWELLGCAAHYPAPPQHFSRNCNLNIKQGAPNPLQKWCPEQPGSHCNDTSSTDLLF